MKLLCNAEAFGYGPTAAIASFFPHLKGQFDKIGFIGTGHTLDLQRPLAYNNLHDASALNPNDPQQREELKEIVSDYDHFLTATDFAMAELAKEVGLKTYIYDPLAWYWPKIPKMVPEADLYLAQDFIGVQKRLEEVKGNVSCVAPILPNASPKRTEKIVLLNFGGLQNPHWSQQETANYALTIYQAAKGAIPKEYPLVVAANHKLSKMLPQLKARSYARDEMLDLLSKSKFTIMTPGLGNIYDAAHYNVPTLWLPPANDSQGQQLDLIKAAKASDADLDWKRFSNREFAYTDDQPKVMQHIHKQTSQLGESSQTQWRFRRVMDEAIQKLQTQNHSQTSQLINQFGRGGAEQVAQRVISHARSVSKADMIKEGR